MRGLEGAPGAHAVAAFLHVEQIAQGGAVRPIETGEDPARDSLSDGATSGGNVGFYREDWFCLSA
jgi:hypothetical protein